ncbi:MAG: hypothetical protein NC254_11450 [bacterium]|nr:hypothetical protein [bacterium]
MKLRGAWIVTMAAFFISACYGIYEKRTYTDVTRDSSYLETVYVAEIPESFALSCCEELERILPEAPLVLRVSAVEELEHLARTSRQRVRVEAVLQGGGVSEGEEIYLTKIRWNFHVMDGYKDSFAMDRGFVNLMEIGEEYLVFVGEQADSMGERIPVYELFGDVDMVIAPVFSYREHENRIVETDGITTYVPYRELSGNEFFAETQAGMDAFLSLKEEMMRRYE